MTALRIPIVDDSTFPKRLEIVRFTLGWSGAKMARFIGVTPATYNNWITGRHGSPQIGRDTIARKFRDEHQIDEEWLLHGPPSVAGGTSEQGTLASGSNDVLAGQLATAA